MDLIRKQTYITVEQDRSVKELAEQYRTTEAEIVRRALDSWLAEETVSASANRFAGLVGFVDGPAEVDHDDIYG